MCHNLSILFEFYNITPTSGWILTSEIVLDGVGKDFGLDLRSSLLTLGRAQASLTLLSLNRSLSFAILLGVLLGTDNDGLRAVHAVDAVYRLMPIIVSRTGESGLDTSMFQFQFGVEHTSHYLDVPSRLFMLGILKASFRLLSLTLNLDVTHLQILIILKFCHKITHKTSELIIND